MFKIKFSKMRRDLTLKSVKNQEDDNRVFSMNAVNLWERPSVRIKKYKGVRAILVDSRKLSELIEKLKKIDLIWINMHQKRWFNGLLALHYN